MLKFCYPISFYNVSSYVYEFRVYDSSAASYLALLIIEPTLGDMKLFYFGITDIGDWLGMTKLKFLFWNLFLLTLT